MAKTLSTFTLTALLILTSCSENHNSHVKNQDEFLDTEEIQSKQKDRTQPQIIAQDKVVLTESAEKAKTPYEAAAPHHLLKTKMVSGAVISPYPAHNPPAERNRESYDVIQENGFINCLNDSLSTFSIDVDTASYANIRRFINGGNLPPTGAVRTEEMINYFNYHYPAPTGNSPFNLSAETGPSPFNKDYKLVKIGLKAKETDPSQLPPSNLVFLIDVSGSMNHPNKLPLLKKSMKLLVNKLGTSDRVSIVVYAGSDHIVLQPTAGNEHETIFRAINNLQPGGSTHASQGILTAYKLAHQVFIPGGNNRVILASDGDFNVGITSKGELKNMIETQKESGVYLTILGFGMGNYQDDTMEILADKGNGNYGYIDSLLEAKKLLVKEMSGTLFTLANDVKIQVEFNPAMVGAYRLIGYENRALEDEDFRDDTKDAGEIGIGHTVTALYEVIPSGHSDIPKVDQLKYQRLPSRSSTISKEMLTVKLRYKPKDKKISEQLKLIVPSVENSLEKTSNDFRFAAAVAGYSMLLKKSDHLGDFTWDNCLTLARNAKGKDYEGYRAEFCKIVEMSQLLKQNS